MHTLCIEEFKATDVVQGVVGYSEVSLFPRHTKDIQQCGALSETVDSGLWQHVRQGSDDILQVELVNALDEPLGAVVHMMYAQPDRSPEFPDVFVPESRRPRRARHFKQCVTFSPLPSGAFRVHFALEVLMADAREHIERLPAPKMIKVLQPLFSVWPTTFAAFLAEHGEDLRRREAFPCTRPSTLFAVATWRVEQAPQL